MQLQTIVKIPAYGVGLYSFILSLVWFGVWSIATDLGRSTNTATFWLTVGYNPEIQGFYKLLENNTESLSLFALLFGVGILSIWGIARDIKKSKLSKHTIVSLASIGLMFLLLAGSYSPLQSFASAPTSGPIGNSTDSGYGTSCSASFCIFTNTISGTQYYYAIVGLGYNAGSSCALSTCAIGGIAFGGVNNAGGATGTNATDIFRLTTNTLLLSGGSESITSGTYTFSGNTCPISYEAVICISNANYKGHPVTILGAGQNKTILTLPTNSVDYPNIIAVINADPQNLTSKCPCDITVHDLSLNGNAANQHLQGADSFSNGLYAENIRNLNAYNIEAYNDLYNGITVNSLIDSSIQGIVHNNYDSGFLATGNLNAKLYMNGDKISISSYYNGNSAQTQDQTYAGCSLLTLNYSTASCIAHNNGVASSHIGEAIYLSTDFNSLISFTSDHDEFGGLFMQANITHNIITGTINTPIYASGYSVAQVESGSNSGISYNSFNLNIYNSPAYPFFLGGALNGATGSPFVFNTLSGTWIGSGGQEIIALGNYAQNNTFTNFIAGGASVPAVAKTENSGSGGGEYGNTFVGGTITKVSQNAFQVSYKDLVTGVTNYTPQGFGTNFGYLAPSPAASGISTRNSWPVTIIVNIYSGTVSNVQQYSLATGQSKQVCASTPCTVILAHGDNITVVNSTAIAWTWDNPF